MSLNLHEMTIEEKLRTMELLWDDICRNVPDYASPQWHGEILKDREEKYKIGKEKFIDWEQAKKDFHLQYITELKKTR
ncbi:MAG: addiction module protein [Pseudomonadota bacterium]